MPCRLSRCYNDIRKMAAVVFRHALYVTPTLTNLHDSL